MVWLNILRAAARLQPWPSFAMLSRVCLLPLIIACLLLVACSSEAARARRPSALPPAKRLQHSPALLARAPPPAGPATADLARTSSQADVSGRKRSMLLGILLPWLYFLCSSMNLTTLPRYVNWAINGGSVEVSSLSAQVYGNIQGLDAFFTFLSVHLVGRLSDRHGRKPFMALASLGLGASYLIMLRARRPWLFYLAAAVDGLTSCMLSQAQALVADNEAQDSNLALALSRFQGLAIGLAFTIGIPLGNFLTEKWGLQAALKLSSALCAVNALLLLAFLPAHSKKETHTAAVEATKPNLPDEKEKRGWLQDAGPLGALAMLTRSKGLRAGGLAYLAITLGHAGMQAVWVNYLSHRFHWSTTLSGLSLMIIGIAVALLPPLFIPLLGTLRAIPFTLITHSLSLALLGSAGESWQVFALMPLVAAGSSCMPILLGHLTHQVGEDEVGALQGACETVRTISSAIASPLFARVFGFGVANAGVIPVGSPLFLSGICSLTGALAFLALQTV
eukprot:gene1415-1539_t